MTRAPAWYVAIVVVPALGFVVSAFLAFWAAQTWQWRLVERGRIPEYILWKRPFVILRPDLRRPSITNLRASFRVAQRSIALLFRPDSDPDLEVLRRRAARLWILTLSTWVAGGIAILSGGLILSLEG